ncbi:MAG: hypothetical protein COT16_00085 [Elusimicrobia bacterium CG08_land_8_20_14_0_20_44_26]|nr:MAG: hypothetical protein COT16_00085 [Elusimicrobia bacterium CG08_land_8_20_14_0_20_44_26]
MNFNKFSATMLATYKKCPRMFKYRYVDKLGDKFRQPRPFLSMGNSVHAALAGFMTRKIEERNFDLLKTFLESEWISEGYLNSDQENEYFHRASDMLKTFFSSGEWKMAPDHIEKWFEVKVSDFILSGRIDRIDGLEVIDYKTGNFVPDEAELRKDFQTIIYTFAGSVLLGAPAERVTFEYLASGKKISIEKNEAELRSDMEDVKKFIAALRSDGEFFPTPHRLWCLYCDFNSICPLAGMEIKGIETSKLTDVMMTGTENAYNTLYEILGVSTTLGGILDFEILTKEIIEVFRSFSGCSKLLLFMKSVKGVFYLRGVWGATAVESAAAQNVIGENQEILECKMSGIEKEPLESARYSALFSAINVSPASSAIIIPLYAREKQIGTIVLAREADVFTQREMIVLNTLANIVQISLDNSIHYTQAIIDDLTGLKVRKYFEGRLREELERFKRFETSFALLMLDLDFFKKVNDTHGHPFGDKILIQFSKILKDSLRNIDILARVGGEEFMALLPETDSSSAYNAAFRIKKAVENHVFGEGKVTLHITTSIGVLPVPPECLSVDEAIDRVDKALYCAKQNGRNCVKIYGAYK